ncbi:MAG: COG3014 family protein, partial [Pseudoalteromonas spongiae]
NIEGALVEVRRANLIQQQALKKNQNELEKAAAKTSLDLNDLYSRYPTMDDMIGSVKNGFQNAFTFYLSGFIYEATGEYNAAYIDYKRAIDIYSENTYLQQDILRLAKYLGFDDEYNYFKARFNADLPQTKNNQVPVLVLIEQGLIPEKTEARIDLPIFTSRDDIRFYSVALPSYANNHEYAAPLSINIGEQTLQSETIVKLSALAAKDLKERMPGIVARQITRLIAKEQFRKSAARNGGDVGNIIATLYNLASERADTRSWLTLANNYQIAKTYLTSGEHTLSINLNGITHPVSFSTDGNKSVLIKVVNLGSTLNTTVYTI